MQGSHVDIIQTIFVNSIKKLVEGYIFAYYANAGQTIDLTPDITKSLKEQTSIIAHNTMSNNFFKNIPWVNNILNNQDLSITQLLKMGIRCLDLDVFNGDMNPIYQTNHEQVAHSVGNHNYRIPINIPGKLIDYLKEIKNFIDNNNPKEPIIVFLENYNEKGSVKALNDEILKIFNPQECYKANPPSAIAITPLNQMGSAKIAFVSQNYQIPSTTVLNKGNYNTLFQPYGETSIPHAKSVDWKIKTNPDQLSVINSDGINKFGQEEISKAVDNQINLIKVDNIAENDLHFVKAENLYELFNSKEMLFLPAAIMGAIMISIGYPEQSREKVILDLICQIVLPFNGRVVYNVTKNGIESFNPEKSTTENVVNILKNSIKSIFNDSVSKAAFELLGTTYGTLVPAASTGINFALNISKGVGIEQSFYRAIDSSSFGLTSFAHNEKDDKWHIRDFTIDNTENVLGTVPSDEELNQEQLKGLLEDKSHPKEIETNNSTLRFRKKSQVKQNELSAENNKQSSNSPSNDTTSSCNLM